MATSIANEPVGGALPALPKHPWLVWRHRAWLRSRRLLHRPWYILGSAPSPGVPGRFPPNTAHVHVKYAGRGARLLGLPPGDLTLLLQKTTEEDAPGLEFRNVLRMRGQLTLAHKLKRPLPFAGFREYEIKHRERDDFILMTLGSLFAGAGIEQRPSNGIALICYAIAVGAPQIIVAGISLEDAGYAYDASNTSRRHVEEDREALVQVARRYPQVVTTERRLHEITGLPLYAGA